MDGMGRCCALLCLAGLGVLGGCQGAFRSGKAVEIASSDQQAPASDGQEVRQESLPTSHSKARVLQQPSAAPSQEVLAEIEQTLTRLRKLSGHDVSGAATDHRLGTGATGQSTTAEVTSSVPHPSLKAKKGAPIASAEPTLGVNEPIYVTPDSSLAHRLDASESDATGPALPVVESVSIDSASFSTLRGLDDQPDRVTNLALDAEPQERTLSVEGYLAALRANDSALDPVESGWRLRMMQLALDRIPEPIDKIESLSPESTDVLGAFIDLTQAVRRTLKNPTVSANGAMQSVAKLAHLLGEMGDLALPHSALCRRVQAFGVYDEMPADEFIAARANQTIVYCEVRNFMSETIPEGGYRTLLASRMELMTPTGQSVWQVEEPAIEDTCRHRRTDFFVAQRIVLPATIPAGQYVLKIMIEDTLANKVNETSIPLEIKSPTSLASGG